MNIVYKTDSLTVFQSDLYMTNTTVLQTPDLILIVDPAWLPAELTELRSRVDKLAQVGKPPYLLFTHSDYDHIIGYRAIPDAKVISSRHMQNRQDKDAILEQIRQFDDDYYLVRDYPIEYPRADIIIDTDGQRLQIGDTSLTFYHSPGHNEDGLFTIVEPGGILFAGDYLSDVEFPYIYYSSKEYTNTLTKAEHIIGRYDIRLLIPGHGNVATDRTEMLHRIRESENYIHYIRNAISSGNEHLFDSLIDGCRFPRNMRKFHLANRSLIQKEMEQQPEDRNK